MLAWLRYVQADVPTQAIIAVETSFDFPAEYPSQRSPDLLGSLHLRKDVSSILPLALDDPILQESVQKLKDSLSLSSDTYVVGHGPLAP